MSKNNKNGCAEVLLVIVLALILMLGIKRIFPELELVWVLAPLWIPVAVGILIILIIIVAAVIKWLNNK